MSIKRLQALAMQYESEETFLEAMSKIYDLAKEDNLNMHTLVDATNGKIYGKQYD